MKENRAQIPITNENVSLEVDKNKSRKRKFQFLFFVQGDSRLMITLAFTGVHTMFLRWHNMLAKHIALESDKLDATQQLLDNEIYEKARALNIAFFQYYVYEKYLPILLGETFVMKEFGLNALTEYNSEVGILLEGCRKIKIRTTKPHFRSLGSTDGQKRIFDCSFPTSLDGSRFVHTLQLRWKSH